MLSLEDGTQLMMRPGAKIALDGDKNAVKPVLEEGEIRARIPYKYGRRTPVTIQAKQGQTISTDSGDVQVSDDLAESVIESIQKSANTGRIGDGKIFVMDVGQAVRIRTGETGSNAL